MQKITLNELPQYSPWPGRLLGSELFLQKNKNITEIEREYDKEKYARLLSAKSLDEAFVDYFGEDIEIAYSRHNELFVDSKFNAYKLNNKLIVDSLRPILEKTSCVVELGAGFGQTLSFIQKEYPNHSYYAGDFSLNGLLVGRKLLPNIQYLPFNFYDDEWKIFDNISNALVITIHALEMLPNTSMFVKKIKQYSHQINTVVNFEPIYENETSLISLLRRRYIEVNDYCQNIMQSIPNATIEKDFFGFNPLLCEARIEWQPQPHNTA